MRMKTARNVVPPRAVGAGGVVEFITGNRDFAGLILRTHPITPTSRRPQRAVMTAMMRAASLVIAFTMTTQKRSRGSEV